jgi:hypothetical protein
MLSQLENGRGERKMGIIKWWNDRKAKPVESKLLDSMDKSLYKTNGDFGGSDTVESKPIDAPLRGPEPKTQMSEVERITNYFAKGGEIVDLTNKPRKENDGFAPDHELLTPFNRANEGTRAGLNALMRGGKR